jgi:hypothetical protein
LGKKNSLTQEIKKHSSTTLERQQQQERQPQQLLKLLWGRDNVYNMFQEKSQNAIHRHEYKN